MSVKFEKETVQTTGDIAAQGINAIKGGKHDLADEIGTALTGGKGNVGKPGYLAVCVQPGDQGDGDVMLLTLHA